MTLRFGSRTDVLESVQGDFGYKCVEVLLLRLAWLVKRMVKPVVFTAAGGAAGDGGSEGEGEGEEVRSGNMTRHSYGSECRDPMGQT